MLRIPPALAKLFWLKFPIWVMTATAFVMAQEPVSSPVNADSMLSIFGNLQAEPDSINAEKKLDLPDFAKNEMSPVVVQEPKATKNVLFLGGGENSPWYHLGVLYAIETYSIPIDSVVGLSWGAYVGYLWTKGVLLDDIQRMLLNQYVDQYVGHNAFEDLLIPAKCQFNLPLSEDGLPSLRHRFVLKSDSNGSLRFDTKSLVVDSVLMSESLAKLQLQEFLYRQQYKTFIPFSVVDCEGNRDSSAAKVMKSLPLFRNKMSGELCSYLALPLEDNPYELPIISVAEPIRENKVMAKTLSPWQKNVIQRAMEKLRNQPGVIVQAHSFADTSRNALIQAGFSAVERHMSEIGVNQSRIVTYADLKKDDDSKYNFNPIYDSLSAEAHTTVSSYWNPEDAGMTAPYNFAKNVMAKPAYDSVRFELQENGDLWVDASVEPTFDAYAGGFGSNVLGPNAFAGISVSYVDQMEIDMDVSGFYGNETYGIKPGVKVSRLWNKNWSFYFNYEWGKYTPLKSYLNEQDEANRILSEKRNDFRLGVFYQLGELQLLSANFFFGNRTIKIDANDYDESEFELHPVSPSIRYELLKGENDRWFAKEGYNVVADVGMQSVGYEFGINNIIPIYWRLFAEARYSHSLTEYFLVSAATAGGLNVYQGEEGGSDYPKSFDYEVLNNFTRLRIKATPWTSEWYDSDMSSHHYGLIRANAGWHYHGSGLWIFGAYVRDFENNPLTCLGVNKIVLEPALRFVYKSVSAYVGMSRVVDSNTMSDLKDTKNYKYFVRIGNYDLF